MLEDILRMYQNKRLGANEICRSCNRDSKKTGFGRISKPLSVYQVGSNYQDNKYRLLFVGKNARGTSSYRSAIGSYVIDARRGQYSASELFLRYNKLAFWNYTKEIVCRILDCEPEEAFESIAISNLIKCNNTMYDEGANFDGTFSDYTTQLMKQNCLRKMKVFWEEINILKPKHIVFYTHYDYDEYLEVFPDSYTEYYAPHIRSSKVQTKRCGAKYIRWWDREFRRNDSSSMRVLLTSHPERKNKKDFTALVASWIQRSPS